MKDLRVGQRVRLKDATITNLDAFYGCKIKFDGHYADTIILRDTIAEVLPDPIGVGDLVAFTNTNGLRYKVLSIVGDLAWLRAGGEHIIRPLCSLRFLCHTELSVHARRSPPPSDNT